MTDRSLHGVNWGNVEIDDNYVRLDYKKNNIFKVPLKSIANSTLNKTDIKLDIKTDNIEDNQDALCEIRFFVPQAPQQNDKQKQKEKQSEEVNQSGDDDSSNQDEDEDDVEQNFYAKTLNELLTKKAKLDQPSGQSLVTLNEISLLVPRGKYTIDMYQEHCVMHGSSHNYRIEYKNIQKGYLLPIGDDKNISFIVQLEQAVKSGNTPYNFFVMQFRKDENIEEGEEDNEHRIVVNVKKEELKQSQKKGLSDLQQKYTGDLSEIIAELFKTIGNVKTVIPDGFKSFDSKQVCVQCNYKTQQGWLFPLKQHLLFANKPVLVIPMSNESVERVELLRVDSTKQYSMFGINILVKEGTKIQFDGIESNELDPLLEYFTNLKINLKKVGEDLGKQFQLSSNSDGDDDDDDDSHDKQRSDQRVRRPAQGAPIEFEDDSDDDDDSFHADIAGDDDSDPDDDFDDDDDSDVNQAQKAKKDQDQEKD